MRGKEGAPAALPSSFLPLLSRGREERGDGRARKKAISHIPTKVNSQKLFDMCLEIVPVLTLLLPRRRWEEGEKIVAGRHC